MYFKQRRINWFSQKSSLKLFTLSKLFLKNVKKYSFLVFNIFGLRFILSFLKCTFTWKKTFCNAAFEEVFISQIDEGPFQG